MLYEKRVISLLRIIKEISDDNQEIDFHSDEEIRKEFECISDLAKKAEEYACCETGINHE